MDQETHDKVQHFLQLAKPILAAARNSGYVQRILATILNRESSQPLDYRDEALNALRENAVETLANLELTAVEAAQILEEGFTLDHLVNVDHTWQKQWSDRVSRVAIDDQERRKWWARVLAGEIQHPGTYSLRTLAVMDTMSMTEAQLFTNLCTYVWESNVAHMPALMLPKEESDLWRPSVHEQTVLDDIGLTARAASPFQITLDKNDGLVLRQGNQKFLIKNDTDKQASVRCGELYLTVAGREIWTLTTISPNQLYIEEMVSEWEQTFTVMRATA